MTSQKRMVLDANILIRAVLGRKVQLILDRYAGSTQFFTPQVCYEDAGKYLPLLFEKRNLLADAAFNVLAEVMRGITVVEELDRRQ